MKTLLLIICFLALLPNAFAQNYRKVGRTLGSRSSWLSTVTAKPMIGVSGYLKGFFANKDSQKDNLPFLEFFISHAAEFETLYLKAGTQDEMQEQILMQINQILDAKIQLLRQLGSADLINHHPDYQEIRSISGDVVGDFENVHLSDYEFGLRKMFDSTPMVFGISITAADIFTVMASGTCIQSETQAKFDSDQELKEFCSYVVNQSNLKLMTAKSKGYSKGKKARKKLSNLFKPHET